MRIFQPLGDPIVLQDFEDFLSPNLKILSSDVFKVFQQIINNL